jgi:hypothetical protein
MKETFSELTTKNARLVLSCTGNARVEAFTDAELTANALDDPENPPLDDAFQLTTRRCPRPGM